MSSKKCTKCEEVKELSSFNKDKTKPDGLYSSCKPCVNINRRLTYGRDSVRIKARKRKQQDFVYDYLSENSCKLCGEEDILYLQFDHLDRKNKVANISHMVSGSMENLKAEMDKCRVVCVKCHVVVTANQFNWYILEYIKDREGLRDAKM